MIGNAVYVWRVHSHNHRRMRLLKREYDKLDRERQELRSKVKEAECIGEKLREKANELHRRHPDPELRLKFPVKP